MPSLNVRTGRFNVTAARVQRWWHRNGEPPMLIEAARLLEDGGVHVYEVTEKWIDCEFLPEKIWEIFSGRPSDPKQAEHYYRKLRKWAARKSAQAPDGSLPRS